VLGQQDPKQVGVCGFYNIIVNVILLFAFVGLNYDSEMQGDSKRWTKFPKSIFQN